MSAWDCIDEGIDQKRLWRALIDNARSKQARLTDNELIALLMTLSGFNTAEIAMALENDRQAGYLKQARGQQIVQSAFVKTLAAGGITVRKIALLSGGRNGRRRQ